MSFASDIRTAARSLGRAPAFTVTASATLVLGIGAAIAIFALVNGVLLRPLPYGEPERLVGAWHDLPGVSMTKANQTAGMYHTYAALARSIDGIGIYQDGAVNVSDPRGGAEPQRIDAAWVSASLVPVLKVAPLVGRSFTEEEDRPNGPNVVLVSEGLWRSRFGADPAIVGKTLEVGGRTREIVGVMPERFRFPTAATQLWMPIQLDPADPYPGGFNYSAVARLAPGMTVEAAQRDFAAVLPRVVERSPNLAPGVSMKMVLDQARPIPVLVPLKEDVTGGVAKTLWIVAAAAAVVLLVACANVTNLILVRADARQRELAVREALGAGRARVLGHFLAESAVLAALAGAAGLGLAALAIRALVRMGPAEIPRLAEVSIDPATVAFALAATAAVALVCSLIPALRLGRVHLANALREGGRGGTASRVQQRVRSTLVAAQIALALVALASSGLLVRTFQRLNAVRPGFHADGVATFWMSLPGARYPNDTTVASFYAQLLERVEALPGVRSAGITSRLPLVARGRSMDPFYPEGDPSYANNIPPLQLFTTVGGDYFETMGIPLLAGRSFERLGVQRGDEAVISQATAVMFWKDSTGRAALGKRFREIPGAPLYTVVGVVGNARDTALAAPPSRTVYYPQVPTAGEYGSVRNQMALAVRTAGEPRAITTAVQRAVRDLDPTLPVFDIRPMTAVLSASMAQLRFTILVLGAAAAVTLVLGAIGLYGVMAYVVTLRSRELGLRIALGASPGSIVRMLTRQGVVLTAFGIAGGFLLYALVARFLSTLLYGVAPTDSATLVAASLLLVATAALASWVPARRTSRLDPADVLRAE